MYYKQTSARSHNAQSTRNGCSSVCGCRVRPALSLLALPPECWYSLIISLFLAVTGCKTATIVKMYYTIKKRLLKQQNSGQDLR